MKSMIKLTALSLTLALSAGYASMATASVNGCDIKRAAIENQIKEAKKYGNIHKVAGLQRALAQLNANCSDSGQLQKAQQKVTKLEQKLAEKKSDVREVQADLNQAKASGDQKKIVKYQKKLADKKSDVKKIQIELKEARADLANLKH